MSISLRGCGKRGQPKDGQIQTGPATGGKLHRKEIDEEILTPGSLHCISGDW